MQDLQRIHPFELIQYDDHLWGIYFPAQDRFEVFDDLEIEVTGYTWIDIIEFYLEHELIELQGAFRYEPNEESCELQGSFENIKAFILNFRPLYFSDNDLSLLIEEMREAWY